MISVVTWKWGTLFGTDYVNRLRNMVERHLHVPHRLVCVTDDTTGIDPRIETVMLPEPVSALDSHCSIRMRQFDRGWSEVNLGPRFLLIDLDVVIVDDITRIVDRPEPLVCWWVDYCNLYAGGVVLQDAGILQGLWNEFSTSPNIFAAKAKAWSGGSHDGSDQDMINYYLDRERIVPARWSPEDGLVCPHGEARSVARTMHHTASRVIVNRWWCRSCGTDYTDKMASESQWEAKVSNPFTPKTCDCGGVLSTRIKVQRLKTPALIPYDMYSTVPTLPEGARIVAVGHRDREVMENASHPWVKEHWR